MTNDTFTGRFDRPQFIAICLKLLAVTDRARKHLPSVIQKAILFGSHEARLEREWLAKKKLYCLPLPFEYEVIKVGNHTIEYLNTTTGFSSDHTPPIDPRTFTSMAFTAAKIMVPRLSMSMELLGLKRASDHCLRCCESVLEAALQFVLLAGEPDRATSSDLDIMQAIGYSASLGDDPLVLDCPYLGLEAVQKQYYQLLQNIQGFLSSLQTPSLRDRAQFDPLATFELPILEQWQLTQMPSRAKIIEDQAAACKELSVLFETCRAWGKDHGFSLEESNVKQRMVLKKVKESQLYERGQSMKCKVRLKSISVVGLKGGNFLRIARTSFYFYETKPLTATRTIPNFCHNHCKW